MLTLRWNDLWASDSVSEARPMASPQTLDPLAHLARAALAADRDATRKLLDQLAPELLRVARMILGPRHPDVEDVLQNSLIGVLQGLPTFRWESTVRHFARRIAAKRALDVFRRGQATARVLETVRMDPREEGFESTPEQHRIQLRALLRELPEEQALALTMRVVLGHSIEEIAEATSAPVNTVRSRMRLAKEALRRRIVEDPALAGLLENPS